MTQYVGTHRPDEDQSHTGFLDLESLGDIHVLADGEAIVGMWVTEGFLDEEPSLLNVKMTTDQRQRLVANLTRGNS